MADVEHKLAREIEAAKLLIQEFKEIGQDDDTQLVADSIEGETKLHEALAKVASSIILEDELNLAGLEATLATLESRKATIKKRIERKKTIILTAMQIAEMKTLPTPLVTLTRKDVPPKVLVTDESLIPSKFFKPADPVLDKAALNAAMKERAAAFEAAAKHKDDEARKTATQLAEAMFPPIPGAEFSNGGETVQFKR